MFIESKFTKASVLSIYTVIVICMWGWYGVKSGFGYETGLVYPSEVGTLFRGFIYWADPLRAFTSFFYHLSYVSADILGIKGSYIPYQIIYAILWVARGYLVFLILNRLGADPLVSYTAGVITLTHASDSALNWVGQLNQFGFIFWTLLAIYLCIIALQTKKNYFIQCLWAVSATISAGLSLFSYESPLFIIAFLPLLILGLFYKITFRRCVILGLYYSMPVFYLVLSIQNYLNIQSTGVESYQLSVLRDDWSISALFGDLFTSIKSSIFFWDWVPVTDDLPIVIIICMVSISLACFFIGLLCVLHMKKHISMPENNFFVHKKLFFLGSCWLVLSFIVYLVLSTAGTTWRTQMLSGPGTAIVLACGIGYVSHLSANREKSLYQGMLFIGSMMICFGVSNSLFLGRFHRNIWEDHRVIISQILNYAPRVLDNTIVVLTGVRPSEDPFGDNMWFDLSIRLAYPETKVAGVYFFKNGRKPPGLSLQLSSGEWRSTGEGFPTMIKDISLLNSIVFSAQENNRLTMVKELPGFLQENNFIGDDYNPNTRIIGSYPDDVSRRRYGPIGVQIE